MPTTRELLGFMRRGAALTLIALTLGATPVRATAQAGGSSSLHAGSVVMQNAEERQLFERLLCECGECQRLPLSSCACAWAERARSEAREELAAGRSPISIQAEYRQRFGAQAIAIPSDEGLDRGLWAVPVSLVLLAGAFLVFRGTRLRSGEASAEPSRVGSGAQNRVGDSDGYEARLDAELARLVEGEEES